MKAINQVLFTNWHVMRWVRLILGAFIAMQAVQAHDALAGLIAAFFLLQAITNMGCCNGSSCSILSSKAVKTKQKL